MAASDADAGARPPHPLQPLNDKEIARARDVLVKSYGAAEKLFFRAATLEEPRREDLVKYLAVEHGHAEGALPALPRLARILYDVIKAPAEHALTDAVVDVGAGTIVAQRTLPPQSQTSYTAYVSLVARRPSRPQQTQGPASALLVPVHADRRQQGRVWRVPGGLRGVGHVQGGDQGV